MRRDEFCIMPPSPYYSTQRFKGLERNEVFGGNPNRRHSIEDGLVIYLTAEDHRTGEHSFHRDPQNPKWVEVKKIAQKRWMEFYKKTEDQFRKRYGRSWL